MNQFKPFIVILTLTAGALLMLSGCNEVKSDDADQADLVSIPVIAEAVSVGVKPSIKISCYSF